MISYTRLSFFGLKGSRLRVSLSPQVNNYSKFKENILMANKYRIRKFLLTLSGVGLICYFCYHMISGDRGILAYFKLNSEITALQAELDAVRAERINLEHKANLLKSSSLDLDLLEERAKEVLGYAKSQEILLIDPGEPEEKKLE